MANIGLVKTLVDLLIGVLQVEINLCQEVKNNPPTKSEIWVELRSFHETYKL